MLRGQPPAPNPGVAPGMTQVSLVHSSDSVRSIANATPTNGGAFAPAPATKMSKPPVRVVAQPSRLAHHQNQQQQLAAPFVSKPSTGQLPTLSVPPMAGRSHTELAEYAEQQRRHIEANRREEERRQSLRTLSGQAAQRVQAMRREVAEEESELRRLHELENETCALRVRNSEKNEELAVLSSAMQEQRNELRSAAIRLETLKRQLEEIHRRRQAASAAALVEQRRMQQEMHHHQQMQQQMQMNRSHERVPSGSERPRASVEPFQVVITKQEAEVRKVSVEEDTIDGVSASKQPPSPPNEPAAVAPGITLPVVCSTAPGASVPAATRQDTSPSPPKDPHPTVSQPVQPPPVPEKPQRSRDPHQLYNNAMLVESQQLSVERPNSLAESMDESRLRSGRTDAVSLRADSLKATKRRSWAASEGTSMSEAENIRRVLLEEQRRGKNHFIPEIPLEEDQATFMETLEPAAEVVPSSSSDRTTTEEESSITSDEEQVEMEVQRRQVKGILRPPGLKKEHRRIEFDPLALMLDAALEGELDLVKASAAKLTDVSSANDEGITALHNAICAGHYEIVRFLIDSDADVNAQDSDGWTPLHCAASCNNLPMVRQLVEGGACVLASTLSDMETPVEKCEEDEEGYAGCLRYLAAAHNATGTLHNGKVYAAYDYEAQYEDELSFEAGDELMITSKDESEKSWWSCERLNPDSQTMESGLIPRTFVSLYPALKYRKRLNFIMFEIPLSSESNNNEKD